MSNNLRVLVCENYQPEINYLLSTGGFDEFEITTFPAFCGQPPYDWKALQISADSPGDSASEVHIFGGACLANLECPPELHVPCYLHKLPQCHSLLLNPHIVDYFIREKAYLLSPGWVKNWQRHLEKWGFDQKTAREFFGETTQKLVLLDSGVDPRAREYLRELASYLNLPSEIFPVGIDNLKNTLTNLQNEWRLAQLRQTTQVTISDLNRQRSDYAMVFDLIGKLSGSLDENKVVEDIIELFSMLYAPSKILFVPYQDVSLGKDIECNDTPEEVQPLCSWMLKTSEDYTWLDGGDSFRMRISYQHKNLGALEIQHVAFPSHKDEYLALGLAISNICGLAISNARTYQRLDVASNVLRLERDKAQRYLDIADVILLVIDQSEIVTMINRKGCEILGYAESEIVGKNWFDSFLPDTPREKMRRLFEMAISGQASEKTNIEIPVVTLSGEERLIAWHNIVLKNTEGEITGILSSGEDITERKKTEDKLWFLSTHDSLTGLYNRSYFETEMERLEHGRQYPVSILMLDVNDLKKANDQYGHAAGDELLLRAAQILKTGFRADEIIARIGGDEFAVLLPSVDQKTALKALDRLNELVLSAEMPKNNVPLSISFGIATGQKGTPLAEILKEADHRMYTDKAQKKAGSSY